MDGEKAGRRTLTYKSYKSYKFFIVHLLYVFFKFQLKDASKLLKTDATHHRMYKLNRLDFSSNYDDKQLTHPTHHINKEEERRIWSDDKNSFKVLIKVTYF